MPNLKQVPAPIELSKAPTHTSSKKLVRQASTYFADRSTQSTRNLVIACGLLFLTLLMWVGLGVAIQSMVASGDDQYNQSYFISIAYKSGWFLLLGLATCMPKKSQPRNSMVPTPETPEHLEAAYKRRLRLWAIANAPLTVFSAYSYNISMENTSVSSNAVIFQAGPAFSFLLAWLFGIERPSLVKFASVLTCTGGVVMMVVFNTENDSEGRVEETVGGFVWAVISCLAFSVFQVLWHKVSHRPELVEDTEGNETVKYHLPARGGDALYFMGWTGVWVLLLMVPLVYVFHVTGFETYRAPSQAIVLQLVGLGVGNVVYTMLMFLCINVSSAVFVSLGSALVVPMSMAVDAVLYSFVMPSMSLVGVVLTGIGFIGFNVANYRGAADKREELRQSQLNLMQVDIASSDTPPARTIVKSVETDKVHDLDSVVVVSGLVGEGTTEALPDDDNREWVVAQEDQQAGAVQTHPPASWRGVPT